MAAELRGAAELRAGDLLHLTREASVQFRRPMLLRLIRVLPRRTYDGWMWIEGYQLDARGDAVQRRELFVWAAGVRKFPTGSPSSARRAGDPYGRDRRGGVGRR
ncbi:hypothetical protein Jiend_30750 [Micromonospora endophytica]|uniref:hypothetical protein n=1 Tax=Micromonospora endophytica TaxID=515350 RepID=UPI001C32E41D|nr:hypothetical protein [Micromonospora endophytica]BCJ59653.1 hypothetical protein Jiend_30750 [Micromonospora endophytica]